MHSLNLATRILASLAAVWMVAFSADVPLKMVLAVSCLLPPAISVLGYRVRSVLLVGGLLVCTFAATWLGGPTPGGLLCGLCAIISAGIFLSRRWAVVTWALTSILVTAGLLLIHWGYETDFDPRFLDPRDLRVVLRFAVTYLTLSLFITLGVTFVIVRLSGALADTQKALEEARRSQEVAENAEDSREQAVTSLIEAQRLGVMGKLSAQMAHDFNNSLQVVLAYGCELGAGRMSPSEIREGAQDIVQVCTEASRLSHQLLSLGQRVEMEMQVLTLSEELKPIRSSLVRIVPSNIEFVWSVEGSRACVRGDVVRLRQAIYNLCINAIHAMPQGGRLTLSVGDEGETAFIDVEDTGVGMAEELQNKIFEPFFTTKGQGGTGLGLVTVREIMKDFGGEVLVESHPGEGTRFRLRFPTCSSSEDTQSGVSRKLPLLEGLSVLVVDDDFRVRNAVSRMLRSARADVSEAGDVSHALELLGTRTFDVVCTDAVMPGVPVSRLVEYLKEHDDTTPVLVCSAYVEEELLRRGIASGKVDYLAKPFSQERLVRKIHRLIGRDAEGRARSDGTTH